MTPELGLAAFDSAIASVKLLIFIIKTTDEVVRFKKTCGEINRLARMLQKVLEDNESTLKTQHTFGDLNALLSKISTFVTRCTTDLSLVQRVWEVTWRKELPAMVGELQRRILYLIMETTAETRSAIRDQGHIQSEMKMAVQRTENDIRRLVQSEASLAKGTDVAKVLAVLELQTKTYGRPPSVPVSFREGDGQLQNLKADNRRGLSAVFEGTQVVCVPLKPGFEQRDSARHILIYSKISAMTLVGRFYGIAEIRGFNPYTEHWMVLQDLSMYQTLAQATETNSLSTSVLERLKIAYELSKTVAYLHSVQIVIKSMTQDSIVLSQGKGGHLEPVVTKLDEARLILEHTEGKSFDLRYEAPEYFSTNTHSTQTDVWCLGVLIAQILLSFSDPLGCPKEVLSIDPDAAKVRGRLVKDGFRKVYKRMDDGDSVLQSVGRVVQSCHARNATLRPSAAYVAEQLFNILSTAGVESLSSEQRLSGVKVMVSQALVSFKKLEKSRTELLVAEDDWQLLEDSYVSDGDPVAAMLLGQAIWRGMKQIDSDQGQTVLAHGNDVEEARRARSAQEYLTFAVDAGMTEVARDLLEVHDYLARAYRAVADARPII